MDINTNQQLKMNQTSTVSAAQTTPAKQNAGKDDVKFADELSKAGKEKQDDVSVKENKGEKDISVSEKDKKDIQSEKQEKAKKTDTDKQKNDKNKKQVDDAIDGLKDIVSEINKIGQKEENSADEVKPVPIISDIEEKTMTEDDNLIDNNMNIQEAADKINLQTETGTNFNNNGQPFAEFVNKEQQVSGLKSTEKELAEEKAILSTMEENMAIAKKNMLLKEKANKDVLQNSNVEPKEEKLPKNITVQNNQGIRKVDTKTNLTVETIVSYDKVVVDKADVDFFVNLVENGSVSMTDIQSAQKSAQVSKTLADLLAKAMNENKPVRIDFDNDISVIIKIDRAGKISADFLPSSQVAEAYLKENLPLLKQRFDDNNIDYNELNQRKQKQDTQDNRKKGRKDE